MSYSALFDSFEYLCYGSTAIRNILSESDVYRRQILTTKVDPRAVRVKGLYLSFSKVPDIRHILKPMRRYDVLSVRNVHITFSTFSARQATYA